MSTDGLDAENVRVSVGVPVRNGALRIGDALDSILNQSMRDIEIIISDNDSTDATEEVCRGYAARDPRIIYYRQSKVISVGENFMFVLAKARAPYFMWAADDDLRAPDFIEELFAALDVSDNAVLAFGDVLDMTRDGDRDPLLTLPAKGASRSRKLVVLTFNQMHHIYGLWRTRELRKLKWIDNDWWPDLPLMMAASMLGDFLRVPNAEFKYLVKGSGRYFDLPVRPGMTGGWLNFRTRARRAWHMARTSFIAIYSVGRVAGPFFGLFAGVLAAGKALYSAVGYFWHWLRVQLGMLPRPLR